jgi:hypothetical protein
MNLNQPVLETAAQAAESVDGECSEQVNCGWSAETDAQAFRYVHSCFAAVSLTEGNLHASQ